MNEVLAEERREWERQTLSMEPVSQPPPRPLSVWRSVVRQVLALLGAAGLGTAAGAYAGDRPTGTAVGVATGILLAIVIRYRDE